MGYGYLKIIELLKAPYSQGIEMALENHEDIRLRKVEEAIIEFRSIAKTVIVDLKERVRVLEKSDAGLDERIASAVNKVTSTFSWIVTGLFSLFCGALLYFNTEVVTVKDRMNTTHLETVTKVNRYHENTLTNTVKLDHIVQSIGGMSSKLDKILDNERKTSEEMAKYHNKGK